MNLCELRRLLSDQGVTLTVTPEGKLRYTAPGGLPQNVIDAMRTYRAELIRVVTQEAAALGTVPRLPADLATMVRAANAGHLQGGAELASGYVPDLGEFVLAWAAAYLIGEHDHAVRRLNEALCWVGEMRRMSS